MKYHQTISARSRYAYTSSMRDNVSMLMVFLVVDYFKPTCVLEIGFFQGQTFGLICEAVPDLSQVTAVDIEFDFSVFEQLHSNTIKQKSLTADFVVADSQDYRPKSLFDFVNVDGARHLRYHDLCLAADCLADNGILMFDNYQNYDHVIAQFLSERQDLVPFLIDGQAAYFHRPTHNAEHFLDVYLPNTLNGIFCVPNCEYHGHMVREVTTQPIRIECVDGLFVEFCKSISI